MGFSTQKLAVIVGISLLVSAITVYASNNVNVVEDAIG